MKNYSVLLLSVLFVGLTGCDRLSLKDSSKVRIQFPSAQSLASKAEAFSTTGGTTNDGRPIPTGFTGSTPINCYLVTVTGPEEALRKNTCTRDDNSMTPRKVGPWTGGVPAGGELTMEVPSGDGREFSIIGFHAPDGQCKDFKAAGFGDGLSRPYMLGAKPGLKLRAGETIVVDVPITYDPDKWFDSCDGPDFPEDSSGPGGTTTPTKLVLEKEWFPANTLVSEACSSVGVSLRDNSDRSASMPISFTFTMAVNGTATPTYGSYSECSQNVASYPHQYVAPNQNYVQVYFKMPAYTGPVTFDISPSLPLQTVVNPMVAVTDGLHGLELAGPRDILPGICYSYSLMRNPLGTGSNYYMSPAPVSIAPSANLTVYSDVGCTTPVTTMTIPAHYNKTDVWVKTTATTASFHTVQLSASGFYTATQKVYRGSGSPAPIGFEINGPNSGLVRGACSSSYTARLVNQYHTTVPAIAATTVNFANLGSFDYYANSTCTNGSEITSVSIPSGQHSAVFYARPKTSGSQTLAISGDTLSPRSYQVYVLGALANRTLTKLSIKSATVCAGDYDKSYCWGNETAGMLGAVADTTIPQQVQNGFTGQTMFAGSQHLCAILPAGTVQCWGKNDSGQVGDGTTATTSAPVNVDASTFYQSLDLGMAHSCGITQPGELKCWGNNNNGQVGDGTSTTRLTPTIVDPGVYYSKISVRFNHTCGITTSGTLKCWGFNMTGQLGDGTTTNRFSPTVIDAGTTYKDISTGLFHTCGITTANQLKCWGRNTSGELGLGTTVNQTTPMFIDTGVSYNSISAGESFTCGITADQKLKCWGANQFGMLGLGNTDNQLSPTEVLFFSASGVAQVATGVGSACAIKAGSSQLFCWGDSSYGALGNGQTAGHFPSPMIVDK